MYRSPTRRRSSRLRWTALTLLVLGLWIAVAPFTRPLPGGAPFSFESTHELGCRTPLVDAFVEDSPAADAYLTPRPQVDDPMAPTTVDCFIDSTPEVGCRTPLVGAFVEDRPTADAYSTPRPQVDDPMAPTTVDCGGRAMFRLVLGTTLVIVAVGLYVIDRRRGG